MSSLTKPTNQIHRIDLLLLVLVLVWMMTKEVDHLNIEGTIEETGGGTDRIDLVGTSVTGHKVSTGIMLVTGHIVIIGMILVTGSRTIIDTGHNRVIISTVPLSNRLLMVGIMAMMTLHIMKQHRPLLTLQLSSMRQIKRHRVMITGLDMNNRTKANNRRGLNNLIVLNNRTLMNKMGK